ncbi:hypothetical protein SAMN02800694_1742 [Luteibacter sp. UNCMF331Sha3.1]|uniref:hypothetical protein n=1 Tax=Luteibacter sp. UNCMF331Sha3.1 TaxID=1502760 RepID=UPI0008D3C265|nr:hypothetical protein [Luteibacter sp. UNCMF331Sha3.1]SEM79918.1 hypothetical protein SAMN02800694_1742 [Luteibacter sp. UNCMF331Sha3.1]
MNRMIFAALILASPIVSADQSTSGNCSPTAGNQAGNAKIEIHCYFNASTVQDAYLKATHPTKVAITGARFTRWLEDSSRPFLSVALKADSDLPAIGLTVDTIAPGTSSRIDALKPFRVKKSNIFQRISTRGITIEATNSFTYPVLSLDDLVGTVHPDIPADFCPYDADVTLGTSPDETKARENESLQDLLASVQEHSDRVIWPVKTANTIQKGVLIRIRYKNIFGDITTLYQQVYVNYARRGATASLWYPSRSALGQLECITNDRPAGLLRVD